MLEINASSFLDAVKRLSEARALLTRDNSNEAIEDVTREIAVSLVEKMMAPIYSCGAKSAWVSAQRTLDYLKSREPSYNIGHLGGALAEIESRFSDHLGFVKLYVVADDRSYLMSDATDLIDQRVVNNFTNAAFDFEESAKCLCLDRGTASVFHSMRALEVGIKALSLRLGIDDPIKASDRNWGKMLEKIKDKIDELYPRKLRQTNSEGSFFERIYANLESIRNPWRNSAMHVDTVYTLEEAEHIFNCTKNLFKQMVKGFNQEGLDIQQILLHEAFGHVQRVEALPS